MLILVVVLVASALLLGAIFCLLLIGGNPAVTHEGRPQMVSRLKMSLERFMIGVVMTVLGGVWLIVWLKFLIVGRIELVASMNSMLSHIILQFVVGLTQFIAGIAILKSWTIANKIFFFATGFLALNTVWTFLQYGPVRHGSGDMMLLFGGLSFAIACLLTALFIADRSINKWQKKIRQSIDE